HGPPTLPISGGAAPVRDRGFSEPVSHLFDPGRTDRSLGALADPPHGLSLARFVRHTLPSVFADSSRRLAGPLRKNRGGVESRSMSVLASFLIALSAFAAISLVLLLIRRKRVHILDLPTYRFVKKAAMEQRLHLRL